jgi:glutathione-independent formaldehyde dehydrogenase
LADNRVVVYKGPGEVAVEEIEYPKLEVPEEVAEAMGMTKEAPHGAILRVVAAGICGSDQHMVRGRTTAPIGQTLGHEITGEVVEKGSDVQFIDVGDVCSVPFNIACGRCRNCNEGKTDICLNVNPARAGATYGFKDTSGWQGGQANYVMVPFADFNLLKFPDREQALEKILDLTMLSDIFPTGYHGAYTAQVTTGSTVYVAGAGPVGLAAAYSSLLLGAAVVIVGDLNEQRLEQARTFGCETINVGEGTPTEEQIADILGVPEVDSAVDAVGFEASGRGGEEAPAVVLNSIQEITRAGGSLGIPGLYVTGDPGASDPDAQEGMLKINFGLGWAKSHAFYTGQCPVKKYNRGLMMSILHDKAHIADAVNATVITLDEVPEGYEDFDKGAATKYVIDPNGLLGPQEYSRDTDLPMDALAQRQHLRNQKQRGESVISVFKFRDQPPNPGRTFHGVRVNAHDFGFVFVTPESRSIVWRGVLDFYRLERTALWACLAASSRVEEFSFLREDRYNIKASLVLFPSKELLQFDLGDADEKATYLKTMKNPNQFLQVRYDMHAEAPHPEADYSFTAENHRRMQAHSGEIAVQVPRLGDVRPVSSDFAKWMLRHHSIPHLAHFVDPYLLAHKLSTVGEQG